MTDAPPNQFHLNRLISTPRGTKAKQVEIIDEVTPEVFRLLVSDGKTLTFLPGCKAVGAAAGEGEDEGDEIAELAQPDDDTVMNVASPPIMATPDCRHG